MLTSYDQYLDACRELCRAQADVVATALADAERVNQAAGRLIDTLQQRHAASRQRIESAANIEELFDLSATTLGEDIGSTTDTFLQMWREVVDVQTRAAHRLPAHLNELATLCGRVMRFASGMPQPLIPLGAWLYGMTPDYAARTRPTAATITADEGAARPRGKAAG